MPLGVTWCFGGGASPSPPPPPRSSRAVAPALRGVRVLRARGGPDPGRCRRGPMDRPGRIARPVHLLRAAARFVGESNQRRRRDGATTRGHPPRGQEKCSRRPAGRHRPVPRRDIVRYQPERAGDASDLRRPRHPGQLRRRRRRESRLCGRRPVRRRSPSGHRRRPHQRSDAVRRATERLRLDRHRPVPLRRRGQR